MSILGQFKYHIYSVTLEGNGEETEYTVTCDNGDHDVHKFEDLREARTAYENAVINSIMRTSFTDVSIYEQQGPC